MFVSRLHGCRVHLHELSLDGAPQGNPIASGHVLGDHPYRQDDRLMLTVVEDDGRIAAWAMDDSVVAVFVAAPEPGTIPGPVPPPPPGPPPAGLGYPVP